MCYLNIVRFSLPRTATNRPPPPPPQQQQQLPSSPLNTVDAAQMLISGQGVERNATAALGLFEEVLRDAGNGTAAQVTALNGLGFAYFQGVGVERNESAARAFFLRAAALGSDSGGANAAFMLWRGLGGERDAGGAVALWKTCAATGHFDCIHSLGRVHAAVEDSGGARDAARALPFLAAAAEHGPWAALVRRGFERYLARDYDGAYLRYKHAAVLGYEIGAANAAYLLQRGLVRRHAEQQRLAFVLLQHSHSRTGGSADSALSLAGFYLGGLGGARRDALTAAALFARASDAGSAEGAFSLGALLEGGVDGALSPNEKRAEALYRRAEALASTPAARLVVRLAIARLRWLGWLRAAGALGDGAGSGDVGSGGGGSSSGLWRAASGAGTRLFAAALGDTAVNSAHEGNDRARALWAAVVAVAALLLFSAVFRRRRIPG